LSKSKDPTGETKPSRFCLIAEVCLLRKRLRRSKKRASKAAKESNFCGQHAKSLKIHQQRREPREERCLKANDHELLDQRTRETKDLGTDPRSKIWQTGRDLPSARKVWGKGMQQNDV
jgi:hypothetical protein